MDLLQPIEGESVVTLPAGPDAPALRYRSWSEASGPARATLAVLSGVMSHSAWFRPLAARWREMGHRVVGVERRGSGLNRSPDDDAGPGPIDAATLLADARRIIEHGRAPDRPLVIVGWCWGAILSVHLAHRMRGDVDGLALLTPGLYPSALVAERMAALDRDADGRPPDEPALPSPITDEMFTEGPALDGFIRRDGARWTRLTPAFVRVSTKLSMAAPLRLRGLTLPLFVALADDDVTTDNARLVAELARLPARRVHTTSLPGAHGLQFDAPNELAARLDAWARDALGV